MHPLPPLPPQPRPFTVLILGSNLAALSLALACTHKNIAFTLLSRSSSIIPPNPTELNQILLHPHAIAILDQLGVWEEVKQEAVVATGGLWGGIYARLGYPFAFVEERYVRQTVYEKIPRWVGGRECVRTKARAVDVRVDGGGVTVITAEMESFCGDVVVCCEGAVVEGEWEGTEFEGGRGWSEVEGEVGEVKVEMEEEGRVWTKVVVRPGVGWWWGLRLGRGGEEMEEVVEGVAETWWTERTLLLGDAAYQFSPLLYLSETLSLEAVATLINLLPPPQDLSLPLSSIPAIFTAFEQSHRPRVEWCQRISSFLTRAVTRSSRWHTLFARWVLPRIPVPLVYEEFSLGATVLNAGFEDRKHGRFWDRIRKGTLVVRTKVFATGVGLWVERQGRVMKVLCRPVVERLPAMQRLLRDRPALQVALGVVGVYVLVSKCGGWIGKVLVTTVRGRRRVGGGVGVGGVGMYCVPGTRTLVS